MLGRSNPNGLQSDDHIQIAVSASFSGGAGTAELAEMPQNSYTILDILVSLAGRHKP